MKFTKKLAQAVSTGVVETNADNWVQNIDAIFGAAKSLQDNIQAVIAYGVEHFELNGSNNPEVFNYLMLRATDSYGNGMRVNTMKNYIKAITGMGFVKNKQGEFVFKKQGKKPLKKNIELVNECVWYEFEKEPTETTPDFDKKGRNSLNSAVTSLRKAGLDDKAILEILTSTLAENTTVLATETNEEPNF